MSKTNKELAVELVCAWIQAYANIAAHSEKPSVLDLHELSSLPDMVKRVEEGLAYIYGDE